MRSHRHQDKIATIVAANIRAIRKSRGMSQRELAEKMAADDSVMIRSVLNNIESGWRTTITVDELAAFGRALNVEPWSLTDPLFLCPACANVPPSGFTCNTCGVTS